MEKERKKERIRRSFTPEFKSQAVALAEELNSSKEAAEKLKMSSAQLLANWVRREKKLATDTKFRKLEEANGEIKRLKKQAEKDKKTIALLKDAAVFFCQERPQ